MKYISIIGSTGSIGTQTLDIVRNNKDIKVTALAAGTNIDLLEKQIREFHPLLVAMAEEKDAIDLKARLADMDVKVLHGMEGLIAVAQEESCDTVVTAIVGMIGVEPTLAAIEAGKDIALANKEPMVMAGKTLMEECVRWEAAIIPVDSEPSAIFQCLTGADETNYHQMADSISRIFLTASGGPFAKRKAALSTVTPQEALQHPRWKMGKKITIDSATLMNKGFESIEIMNLFNLPEKKVQIVIHPQSIIHSAVEYQDGSILAQMGAPDMRLPIQYAITYPEKKPSPVQKLNLFEVAKLEFMEPDFERFPCLALAFEAARAGGFYPAALSAADEVAVDAFLKEQIKFTDIPKLIYTVLKKTPSFTGKVNLTQAAQADEQAHELALAVLQDKSYKKAII